MFRDSVKSTGHPLYLPVSPSLPFPCVTVCHPISTGLYEFYNEEVTSLDMVAKTKVPVPVKRCLYVL